MTERARARERVSEREWGRGRGGARKRKKRSRVRDRQRARVRERVEGTFEKACLGGVPGRSACGRACVRLGPLRTYTHTEREREHI